MPPVSIVAARPEGLRPYKIWSAHKLAIRHQQEHFWLHAEWKRISLSLCLKVSIKYNHSYSSRTPRIKKALKLLSLIYTCKLKWQLGERWVSKPIIVKLEKSRCRPLLISMNKHDARAFFPYQRESVAAVYKWEFNWYFVDPRCNMSLTT